mmetsp:Transcript_5306/g.8207  ORF Transcript_5306/g.8207 Transcript_5306/m.8207 type:complete len:212 (-) Transcript_5306:182-817(-)
MNENLSPQAMMKLMKDIRDVTKNTPEGIVLHFSEENMTCINADIEGPEGTPFQGGVFRCMLRIGSDFPNSPPKGFFLTKIFHPNVSSKGEICVNTLKKDWKPAHGLKHVLMVIRCLLIHPNPESALNEEAGKLLLEEYDSYSKRALMFTKLYATPKGSNESKESKESSCLKASSKSNKSKATSAKSKSSKVSKSSKSKSKRRQKGSSLKRL